MEIYSKFPQIQWVEASSHEEALREVESWIDSAAYTANKAILFSKKITPGANRKLRA